MKQIPGGVVVQLFHEPCTGNAKALQNGFDMHASVDFREMPLTLAHDFQGFIPA